MKVLATRALASLVVTVAAGACGATPPSPSPAAAEPSATSPLATLATSSRPSATPMPDAEQTSAASSAALVLAGTWVMPQAGMTLTSYVTTLAAKPTASGPGVTTFTKVVFSGTWAGGPSTVMCKATRPDDSGVWRCRADLLALKVPPGRVRLSFDVYGDGGPIARSPDGFRRVTYSVPPPKPANPRWTELGAFQGETGPAEQRFRVGWSAPAGYADKFLIYNTWECPRDAKRNVGTPCFVQGTPVDVSLLELLQTAPGNARSSKLRLASDSECGPLFGTILLRARNAFGGSAFAIVEAALVPDPRDIIC